MLAGLSKEHKDRLHLKDATHYKYLTGVGLSSSINIYLRDHVDHAKKIFLQSLAEMSD